MFPDLDEIFIGTNWIKKFHLSYFKVFLVILFFERVKLMCKSL